MNTGLNTLLANVDKLANRLGPVDGAVTKVLARVLPQTTARACGGVYCYTYCQTSSSGCQGPFSPHYGQIFWGDTQDICDRGLWSCVDNVCCGP
jgi:hypothetical protein